MSQCSPWLTPVHTHAMISACPKVVYFGLCLSSVPVFAHMPCHSVSKSTLSQNHIQKRRMPKTLTDGVLTVILALTFKSGFALKVFLSAVHLCVTTSSSIPTTFIGLLMLHRYARWPCGDARTPFGHVHTISHAKRNAPWTGRHGKRQYTRSTVFSAVTHAFARVRGRWRQHFIIRYQSICACA